MPDRWVNPQGWGQQHVQAPSGQPLAEGLAPSPRSQSGRPPQWGPPNPNPLWRRKGFWVVAVSIGTLLLVVGLLSEPDQAPTPTAATASTAAPTTSAPPAPTTTAPPPTTVQTATVPRLVGMKTGQAKDRPVPSWPALDDQLQADQPIRLRHRHRPIQQGRHGGPSGCQRCVGGRQGTAATAHHSRTAAHHGPTAAHHGGTQEL